MKSAQISLGGKNQCFFFCFEGAQCNAQTRNGVWLQRKLVTVSFASDAGVAFAVSRLLYTGDSSSGYFQWNFVTARNFIARLCAAAEFRCVFIRFRFPPPFVAQTCARDTQSPRRRNCNLANAFIRCGMKRGTVIGPLKNEETSL